MSHLSLTVVSLPPAKPVPRTTQPQFRPIPPQTVERRRHAGPACGIKTTIARVTLPARYALRPRARRQGGKRFTRLSREMQLGLSVSSTVGDGFSGGTCGVGCDGAGCAPLYQNGIHVATHCGALWRVIAVDFTVDHRRLFALWQACVA